MFGTDIFTVYWDMGYQNYSGIRFVMNERKEAANKIILDI
jgi:hypothetical protein